LKGFVLVAQVKELDFEKRWEAKKFVLNRPNVMATEVKMMVDDVQGGPNSGDGMQLGQFMLYH